ncbi:unnamed protein product [Spirodela intermedia]|uniref:Uncharacterized protein n=1 Tax=Spirodela intermedia TaxID=51605 RepID=A0A7I8JPA6_SPIIN|nr:unnamed protein product [Spirodela intermedia]CAA6672008.1 unnamed protein product [Spirodela intermedia]
MEVEHVSGASFSVLHSKRRLFIAFLTSQEDLEIAHVVFVQGEPSRPKLLLFLEVLLNYN